ncbi:MAG: hypothetical protein IPL59_12855 [Candidatus Competibacteraceae bacterium]|uniref:Uncharacterized protein n=1 Tax=Candidatus Contendobacter odensis Run_B_J11 TaxID=1400861 RepID=A0A7U7J2W8_9GAMM|nr:hypothetical protein [Candidatus Contendobacter odensis]MBK8535926.1 hypothetical protein [Candidatus Competibacteraceae bacterium]MBK8750389.1 hypothetical protein [Candidatus Competibacteraceae bacterium]CDH43743.1 hypothetical protein BN874_130068 [Candidatus Contendobacter odensis Run_B_J11]
MSIYISAVARPITQAIAACQQPIAAALEQVQHQIQQAGAEKQAYQTRQAELDSQRETWLAQTRQEVAVQREVWLATAQREVDTLRADGLAAWRREQAENQRALQQEAAHRLTEAVRHALRDLAEADLESRMLKPLLAQLHALDTSFEEGGGMVKYWATLTEQNPPNILFQSVRLRVSDSAIRFSAASQKSNAD